MSLQGMDCSRVFSEEEAGKLDAYASMLMKWNRHINLCGASSLEEIRNLMLDSFYLAEFFRLVFPSAGKDFNTWDLGAGAGLPGIPLRILWHSGHYVMIESRARRALFLANVLATLKLADTTVYNGRAETFFTTSSSRASCIVSRAFMPWEQLLSFCQPYLAPRGMLIIMASASCPALPTDFRLVRQLSYATPRGERWFWALESRQANAS